MSTSARPAMITLSTNRRHPLWLAFWLDIDCIGVVLLGPRFGTETSTRELDFHSLAYFGKCVSFSIPVSRYYDRRTTVTKSTNVVLIKDMHNPLDKTKQAQPVVHVPITTGPPLAALSLEGFSIASQIDEAIEQLDGQIRLTPSNRVSTGIMITVPYAFLEKFV